MEEVTGVGSDPMSRFRPVSVALVALLLAGCGGGEETGDEDVLARARPATTATTPTTAAATGACGLKPLTFVAERWQGVGAAPSGAGVLWEQTYTFSNPNTVDVRLQPLVIHLRLTGSLGYFLKMARSTFRPAPDEVVPAGRDQQRVAYAWLDTGNTAATEDIFVTTSARTAGGDCVVPVDRLQTVQPPPHVLALPNCDPQQATAPC